MKSTLATRWVGPLLLISIGAGLSIFVAMHPSSTLRLSPGMLTGLPVGALLTLLVVRATSDQAGRVGDLIATLLVAFLVGLHILILGAGVGLTDRLDLAIPVCTAVLFLAIAPAMATLEPGSALGLRVRATLASAPVWRTTHRRLGLAFGAAGALGLVVVMVDPMAALAVTGGLPAFAMLALARGAKAPVEESGDPRRPNEHSDVDDPPPVR